MARGGAVGGSLARALAAARAGGGQTSSPSLSFYERLVGGAGNVIAFVALVALAARVEFPIDSLPTVSMVLLGVLALVASVLAFCSAGKGGGGGGDGNESGGGGGACRCAAATFVALQLIGVGLQSVLTLLLFVRFDEAVKMVLGGSGAAGAAGEAAEGAAAVAAKAAAERGLVAARWVELCLLLPLQSAALALGMATTCCGFGSGGDDADAAPDQAAKLTSLAALRGDVERAGGGGAAASSSLSAAALGVGAMYERTRGALVAKYGKALAGKAFWRWR